MLVYKILTELQSSVKILNYKNVMEEMYAIQTILDLIFRKGNV